jgi:hypothetical protein
LYREALRAILGAPTDAALGFFNARSRRAVVKLEDVNRQQLLHSTAALGVGTLVLGPVPTLLEGIEPARVFQFWNRAYGGGLTRDAVMGQLRWSAGLLEATCPARLRPELLSSVGDLANIAGYMAQVTGVTVRPSDARPQPRAGH